MDRIPPDIEAELAGEAGRAAALERQRAAVTALRALDDAAPETLRHAVAQLVDEARAAQRPRARRRLRFPAALRPRVALATAGAFAAAAAVLALVLSGGTTRAQPTVQQTALVALRGASGPAPATLPDGRRLAVSVAGIVYPTWSHVGWRAVGQRSDRIGGHAVRTVYYANAKGARVAYAIADGHALPVAGGRVVPVGHARLRVLRLAGGTQVVTWQRDGHTCILAGGGDVPPARLVTLASYET